MKLANGIRNWVAEFFKIFPANHIQKLHGEMKKWTTNFMAAIMGGGPRRR